MNRLNAALLAGVVTVLLFAAVFGLVDWLTGTAGFWRVVQSPLFLLGIVAFNAAVLVPFAVWQRRRAKPAEEDDPPTPLQRRSRPINPRKF